MNYKIKLKSGKTYRANIRDLSNHKKRDITVYVHMLPESNAGWSNYSANSFLPHSFLFQILAYMSVVRFHTSLDGPYHSLRHREGRHEVILPGLDTLVIVSRKYWNSDLQEPQF